MQSILTKKEIAQKLRISERTVDSLRKNKQLPCIPVGRSIRFLESAIDAWLQRQHQEHDLMNPEADKEKPTDT